MISEKGIQALRKWKDEKGKDTQLFMGVDIGGTNTRIAFACGKELKDQSFVQVSKFKVNNVKELLSKFEEFGKELKEKIDIKPIAACIAAAGVVSGSEVVITNYAGASLEEKKLEEKDLPNNLFPEGSTRFVNDLAGTCYGIVSLNACNDTSTFFKPLWGSLPGNRLQQVPYLVMAMGTGLGCALLIPTPKGHQVLALEFGHTLITRYGKAHPDAEEESKMIDYLCDKLYEGKHSLEWEDICSGRGLKHCYEFVTRDDPKAEKNLNVPTIVKKALESNAYAEKAVFLHYKYLFRAAQNQVCGFQAKGVFLAGDNQVNNDTFVIKHKEQFRTEFENHTKAEWLNNVPVLRQVQSYNLNLEGCIFVAKQLV